MEKVENLMSFSFTCSKCKDPSVIKAIINKPKDLNAFQRTLLFHQDQSFPGEVKLICPNCLRSK